MSRRSKARWPYGKIASCSATDNDTIRKGRKTRRWFLIDFPLVLPQTCWHDQEALSIYLDERTIEKRRSCKVHLQQKDRLLEKNARLPRVDRIQTRILPRPDQGRKNAWPWDIHRPWQAHLVRYIWERTRWRPLQSFVQGPHNKRGKDGERQTQRDLHHPL